MKNEMYICISGLAKAFLRSLNRFLVLFFFCPLGCLYLAGQYFLFDLQITILVLVIFAGLYHSIYPGKVSLF